MRILAIGDIVGRPGRALVRRALPELVRDEGIDLVVANGENAAGGMGITPETADELLACGIAVLTTGNHAWKRKEAAGYLAVEDRVVRPYNYPEGTPGRGWAVVEARDGTPVAVLNLAGRVFFPQHLDDPFRTVNRALAEIAADGRARVVVLDAHAEATSEKIALGWYLDGRVSAVLGTHTHVQTADERILPRGTAYLSDLGMTGPIDGVLGMDRDLVLERFVTQLPVRFEVAKGPSALCGAIVDVDPATGRAAAIRRVRVDEG